MVFAILRGKASQVTGLAGSEAATMRNSQDSGAKFG